MKKIFLLFVLFVGLRANAITTQYRFVSAKWESKIGIVKMDGKTDGWMSNKDATDYNAGYHDAQGQLYSAGVGVKTSTTTAGATSLLSFQKVTRVTVNYCQNSSKGKGAINVWVGDSTTMQTTTITRPEKSGEGVYNRDLEYNFSELDGNVSFSVDCTENGIYINTITIEAVNGSEDNPDVSEKILWIVTDPDELKTGDVVMFGVADASIKEVMSYYDEYNSQNNIYSASGVYDEHRVMLGRQEDFLYTIERYDSVVAFIDAGGAYLVASGGNPTKGNNNYLTIWNNPISPSYGNYGLWRITVDDERNATIESMGVSRSKYIQYNPNKTAGHAIFACYATPNSFVKPRLYKLGGNNRTGIDDANENSNFNSSANSNCVYSLSGQRVDANYKGFIIKGNKKFLNIQ